MGMSENNLLALLNNIYRFDSSLIEFFSLSFFSFFLEIVDKQTMHSPFYFICKSWQQTD